jgi:hypothetical protein
MDKALVAYLWDDAPTWMRERIPHSPPPPQVLILVPARWGQRAAMDGLPLALATLVEGYSPPYWGKVERVHQPDGSLIIACSRAT